MLKYFDVHSHISFPEFDHDREEVLERMKRAEVGALTVGVDLLSSKKAVAFVEGRDNIFATIGLHPRDNQEEVFDETSYKALVQNPNVVAIGECGLDYYRIDSSDQKEKKRQRDAFEKQVAFALHYDKPLMLHCRPSRASLDAYEDVLELLAPFAGEHGAKLRGNVHFFVGDVSIAKRFLELGFSLSFTGVITFSNDYDTVIQYLPLTMLLSETDAPYVSPIPHRGERNEPSHVPLIVKRLADIRGEDEESVRHAVHKNAVRVFDLPLK